VTGGWIYVAVAALHLPGIAILALLLRDLAASDPPDAPEPSGGPGGGTPPGWRWQRRPRRDRGPRPARSSVARSGPAARG
jgi:hypothetical protein